MVRLEIFILFGFLLGVPSGVFLSYLTRRYLAWRDERIVKVRVEEELRTVEGLKSAGTDELLVELSKRDLRNEGR